MRLLARCLLLVCLASTPALSQVAREPPSIIWLRVFSPELPQGEPLRVALARHGAVDGRDYRLSVVSADGQVGRMPALAAQAVEARPSVIVAFGPDALRETRSRTRIIPIVGAAAFLEEGFATTLARPSDNVTGVSLLISELDPKKLEVLRSLLPGVTRIGVLNDASTSVQDRPALLGEAARRLGLTLTVVDVKVPEDFEPAFETLVRAGAGAVNVNASTLFATMRRRIGELSLKHRLPAMCQWRTMVETGCIASYGAPLEEMMDLVAAQVVLVLKGVKPDAIPIMQPRKFELVLNADVARKLGVAIPPSILIRADEVIE